MVIQCFCCSGAEKLCLIANENNRRHLNNYFFFFLWSILIPITLIYQPVIVLYIYIYIYIYIKQKKGWGGLWREFFIFLNETEASTIIFWGIYFKHILLVYMHDPYTKCMICITSIWTISKVLIKWTLQGFYTTFTYSNSGLMTVLFLKK